LLWHRDARVAAGAECLNLSNRHRAFVLIVSILGGSVEPTALRGLGITDVLHGTREDVLEFLAAILVVLIAVDGRKEERAEAVAVHVATGLGGVLQLTDQAVAGTAPLTLFHEPVRSPADVVGVLTFPDGAAFHEKGHAGEGGHGHGILVADGSPVAV